MEGEDLDTVGTNNSFLKSFIEILLIYSAVLVSGVWQSDSVIHIYILFRFFFIIGYYKILNIVSCAIQ